MQTIEVLHIPVNEAFTAGKFDKLRAGAQKAGIVNQSYGRDIEDSSQLYWILHFDQGFEPKDFVWPEAEYGDYAECLARISTAAPPPTFCQFKTFSKEITKAPVTEIVIMTLKDGMKYKDVESIMDAFGASVIGNNPGLHGASWAPNSSNDREVYVFPAWDSIETRNKFNESPAFLKYLGEVGAYMVGPPKTALVRFQDHQNL